MAPASARPNSLSTTSAVPALLIAHWQALPFNSTERAPQSSTRQQHRWRQSCRTPLQVAPRRLRSHTRGRPQWHSRSPLLPLPPVSSHSIPPARDLGPASIRTARLTQRLLLRRLVIPSPATRQVRARRRHRVLTANPLRFRCPNRVDRK